MQALHTGNPVGSPACAFDTTASQTPMPSQKPPCIPATPDAAIERLSNAAVSRWLAEHPSWRHEPARGAIAKDFVFGDFAQAFAFMSRVAVHAEDSNHHPEWSNVYNRVSMLLTTHDAGGLSARDLELANAADAASSSHAALERETTR